MNAQYTAKFLPQCKLNRRGAATRVCLRPRLQR